MGPTQPFNPTQPAQVQLAITPPAPCLRCLTIGTSQEMLLKSLFNVVISVLLSKPRYNLPLAARMNTTSGFKHLNE